MLVSIVRGAWGFCSLGNLFMTQAHLHPCQDKDEPDIQERGPAVSWCCWLTPRAGCHCFLRSQVHAHVLVSVFTRAFRLSMCENLAQQVSLPPMSAEGPLTVFRPSRSLKSFFQEASRLGALTRSVQVSQGNR